LTDQFARPGGTPAAGTPAAILNKAFDDASATAATFFANAIDTKSNGIDFVVTHKASLSNGVTFKTDFSGTISQTRAIGGIHGSQILIDNGQINRYYSEASRVYMEEAVPRVKANLTNTLTYKKFNLFLRNVYFGAVTDPNTADVNGDGYVGGKLINGVFVETEHPEWSGNIITDLSVGYEFSKSIKFTIGANNLLDIYPDKNLTQQSAFKANAAGEYKYFKTGDTTIATGILAGPTSGVNPATNLPADYVKGISTIDLSNSNQFVYSRNVSQLGQNGRFVFARLNYKF
jgi:iron complex outermembrane receptor protein